MRRPSGGGDVSSKTVSSVKTRASASASWLLNASLKRSIVARVDSGNMVYQRTGSASLVVECAPTKMDALRRREFLAAMAAFGAAGLMPDFVRARAQESSAVRRLDLHHHFASPGWKKRMAQAKRQGWDTFQDYSPARSIESMDKAGIQTALISTSTPGLWFIDNFAAERQDAIGLAPEGNEYAPRPGSDYKATYGFFAVLPMPDVDASLREIAYALDTLKADGIGLVSSYGDMWLGDARLQPVFDELNRRRAIVYTHPTDAACWHALANSNPSVVE